MRPTMTSFATGLREAWALATPFFYSEQRWAARGLLVTIIVLNLTMVFFSVVLTYWNRDFFNDIQAMNGSAAYHLLFLYGPVAQSRLIMPGLVYIIGVYIVIAVYAFYLNQLLQIRWRQWMTHEFINNWLADRAYYGLSLRVSDPNNIDNPDQRIAEDIRDFTTNTLALGLDFISNFVTLLSFVFVLFAISGSIKLFGITIPGYMVWVALLYSIFGTIVTHLIGRKLINLSFAQQKVEADFRFGLIRIRENPEAVALYGGEADEATGLKSRFTFLRANWVAIMRRTRLLNFFTIGFTQVSGYFPLIFALPRYFAGAIGLGGLTQIQNVFGQVQGALSWFVSVYYSQDQSNTPNLVSWRATISRLHGFQLAVSAARATSLAGPRLEHAGAALSFQNLTLSLPDGRKLLDNASLTLPPGQPVVLTGPSGAGKSTLFRAIAGIWPFGSGTVTRAAGTALFLPQRPYFPLGSLKRSLAYPAAETAVTDEAAAAALRAVELPQLANRLADHENWGQLLSGGEQQRLAIARALLARPDWLFLDEATAALDPPLAKRMFALLRQSLPATTIVAISHSETEIATGRHLTLTPGALGQS